VVTDTGSFKYQSTTADTHYMAAHLLESGVDGFEIQKNIYEQRRIAQIKLLGEVIQSLQFSASGKIVWIVISQNMIKKVKGSDEDVDGFTEFLRSIQDVEISFMILEKSDGTHRISFRSSGAYTVNDVAKIFNGGGHKFAAGASMKNISANDIEKKINILLEF
jgi:phosphoesterase RecJ-like protein